MRVTYFNYLWDIDGISAGSAIKGKELIRALNELGHQATIHWRTPQPLPQERRKEKMAAKVKKALAKFAHGPKCLALNAKHVWQEQAIIAREKPDILFSRLELFSGSAAFVARRNRLPFVLEVDCPTVWEYTHFAGRDHFKVPILPAQVEKYNLQTADAVIVISNILRDYLLELGVDGKKMFVIPNGADSRKFRPSPPPPELQAKYKTAPHTVIGWIGALHGWSGLDMLIETAKQILQRRPDVAFMFVGGGQNQAMIETAFANHPARPRVILPGQVPHEEVPRYLSLMDIVFAPYPKRDFWYPSSMKIFEYMAAAKTVVATDVGQVGEVIQDGVNGILYDPARGDALIPKVIKLVDDPQFRQKLGCNARETVEQYYTWERHARQLEQIFSDILQKK